MNNVLIFKPSLNNLKKLLKSLEKDELEMGNPLLCDWFRLRNEIRKTKKAIQELENAKKKT